MVIHHILQHCGFEVSVARVVNANDSTDGRRRAKRTSGRGGPHPNRKRQRDSLNGNGSDRHRPAPATVIDIDGGES
ncbi:hypothetical protein AGDE_15487 [Angomonas deanei]|nr:hypothetical protein AGDE_15487 [Angomonas deanei]|eukprot:EPY18980.1 hypothetical protein AGDE_15487 [Angomonas deanei]